MKRKDPGLPRFGVPEALLVALFLALLAQIAWPNLRHLRTEAEATELALVLERLREAALEYRSDQGAWPPSSAAGQAPVGLSPYLPGGFSFSAEGYRLAWEHWTLPSGLPSRANTEAVVGISLETPRKELGAAVSRLLDQHPHYVLGDRYTFIIAGM